MPMHLKIVDRNWRLEIFPWNGFKIGDFSFRDKFTQTINKCPQSCRRSPCCAKVVGVTNVLSGPLTIGVNKVRSQSRP